MLTKGLRALGYRWHLALCVVLFAAWSLAGGVIPTAPFGLDSRDVFLFCYLYTLMSWIRWYGTLPSRRTCIEDMIGLFALTACLLMASNLLFDIIGLQSKYCYFFLNHPARLIPLVFGFLLFSLLSSTRFRSGAVNRIAQLTFGVYLIHESTFVRLHLWGLIPMAEWIATGQYLLYIPGAVIAIFGACAILEKGRQLLSSTLLRRAQAQFANCVERCVLRGWESFQMTVIKMLSTDNLH